MSVKINKSVFILKVLLFGIFLFFIPGCKNFMSGGKMLDDLNTNVDYIKAPLVNVTIAKINPDDNSAISNSELAAKQKVGYPFEIFYTPNSNFYFVKWQAVDSENNAFSEEDVFFEDATNATTNVTINTEAQVFIQAVSNPIPTLTVSFVKSDEGCGNYSSIEHVTLGINEEYSCTFTENLGYQFIKWQASNNNVEILDEKNNKVSFVVKAGGTVDITAVCVVRPKVSTSNTMNLTSSICKDTSVIINFNHDLAKEIAVVDENGYSLISQIKLLLSGNELHYGEKEPFNTPYFYKTENGETQYNQIIIPANKLYSINVEGEKTIQVIIPETLYYVDSITGEKITIGSNANANKWTYRINNTTNTQAVVSVLSDSTLGSFSQGSNGSFNIGESVVYEFSVKENYKFNKWVITQVPANIVSTTDITDKSITLKIQDSGTISLKPTVFLIPKCTSTPEFTTEGDDFDTPLVITFNKKIKEPYLKAEGIHNYIKIEDKDDSTKDYFDYYDYSHSESAGKTVLTFKPKYSLRDIFTGGITIKDIRVTLSDDIEDVDNLTLEGTKSWYYRVSDHCETVPPVIDSILISRQEDFSGSELITKSLVTEWTSNSSKNDFANHHINKTVYLQVTASDPNSGSGILPKLYVKEQAKLSTKGESLAFALPASKEAELIDQGADTNPRTMVFKYEIDSEYDGVINLSLGIEDKAGNKSNTLWSFDVIKDTKLDLADFLIYNTICNTDAPYSYTYPAPVLTYSKINNTVKNIYIDYADVWFVYKGSVYSTPITELTAEICTGTDISALEAIIATEKENSKLKFEYADLSAEKDNYISISLTDDFGNSGVYKTVIPHAGKIAGHYYDEINDKYVLNLKVLSNNEYAETSLQHVYYFNTANTAYLIEETSNKNLELSAEAGAKQYSCAAQGSYIRQEKNNNLYLLNGLLGSIYSCADISNDNSQDSGIPQDSQYSVKRSKGQINSCKDTVTVKWDDDVTLVAENEYYFEWAKVSDVEEDFNESLFKEKCIKIKVTVSSTGKPEELSFVVPNESIWCRLCAKDSNGYVTVTPEVKDEPTSLDDTTPPTVISEGVSYSSSFCGATISDKNFDSESVLVEYWIVPYFDGVNNLTETGLSDYPHFSQRVNKSYYEDSINFYYQLKDVGTEKYSIFSKVYDKQGNYFFGLVDSLNFNNMKNAAGKIQEFSIVHDVENPLELTISIPNNNYLEPYVGVEKYNVSKGCFINDIKEPLVLSEGNYSTQITLDNCFYIINVSYEKDGVVYTSVPQLVSTEEEAEVPVRFEAVSDISSGADSEKNYLLFTIASKTDYKTDYAAWFKNGFKSNFKYSNNFTLYSIEDSVIENNDYYVMCCFDSKGNFKMTKTKQYKTK